MGRAAWCIVKAIRHGIKRMLSTHRNFSAADIFFPRAGFYRAGFFAKCCKLGLGYAVKQREQGLCAVKK